MQLLKVMSRLTQPDVAFLPYFLLCREIGVRAVDGMVKGRILDLRWTETVTKEGGGMDNNIGGGVGMGMGPGVGPEGIVFAGSSGTAVETSDEGGDILPASERDILPASERDVIRAQVQAQMHVPPRDEPIPYEEIVMDVVGPKLVATTPIMRYAMEEVVAEYEDEQSVSEYASLSDVDEY